MVGDEEPPKYVRQIDGRVFAWLDDERKVPGGKFTVFVVNAELVLDEGDSIGYAMDVSRSTLPYLALYGRDMEYRPRPPNSKALDSSPDQGPFLFAPSGEGRGPMPRVCIVAPRSPPGSPPR